MAVYDMIHREVVKDVRERLVDDVYILRRRYRRQFDFNQAIVINPCYVIKVVF